MNQGTTAAVKLIVFTFAAIAFAALAVWLLSSCAPHTARTTAPTAIYGEISPLEYAAAETAFSGESAAPTVEYWTDYRCQELLDQRDAFSLWSAITGGLAGAGGITTAVTDKDVPQWCIGGSSLVFGSVSAGLAGAAVAKTRRFEEYCSAAPESAAPALMEMPDELDEHDAGAE